MKKCRSVRVSGLLYTWFVTIASFSSFSFVLCLAFHHPFARHPPFGGSNIEQPRLVAVYRYDCRGGNPMIMRVRSRVGPDVIFKVISSHLIRLATCVFRRLVGQGPRDRCVSITMPLSPRFYHPSRTSDRAIYFSIIYTYRYMYVYIEVFQNGICLAWKSWHACIFLVYVFVNFFPGIGNLCRSLSHKVTNDTMNLWAEDVSLIVTNESFLQLWKLQVYNWTYNRS